MDQFAEQVTRLAAPSIWLSQQMLKDVRPEIFARKPAFAGKVIDTNHPAFVYGHLSTYPAKLMQMVGADPDPAAVPTSYDELFTAGKECRDDPSGTTYPSMSEVTGNYFRAYNAFLESLKAVKDAQFFAENPREGRMKEMFPQVGGMIIFMLTSHIMMHLGQISAWRRCYGLGPVM
jgi:hypothetical protein